MYCQLNCIVYDLLVFIDLCIEFVVMSFFTVASLNSQLSLIVLAEIKFKSGTKFY